jgi:hypothetical protein
MGREYHFIKEKKEKDCGGAPDIVQAWQWMRTAIFIHMVSIFR